MNRKILHFLCFACWQCRLKSLIGRFVLGCLVLTLGVCRSSADVAFINGSTNTVDISGAVQFDLAPGESLSFVPSSSATNEVDFGVADGEEQLFPLQDGALYAVYPDGSVLVSNVMRSNRDDDSVLSSYFMYGLESGTGLGAVLFGWIAVRKGLRLGDLME
jgi:hypothetical protein